MDLSDFLSFVRNVSPSGLTTKQKAVVGVGGAARAASGGMLATALIVYVGRQGSPLAVGVLAAVFFLIMTVFAPLWGILADLTGRHRDILLGLGLLITFATLAFLLVRSVWGVIGFRGLYAVFAVGFGPLLLSLVCTLAGRDHRGRTVGFVGSSLAVGDMIGQILIGVLLGVLAISDLYLLIAAISLVGTAVLAVSDDLPRFGHSDGDEKKLRTLRVLALPSKAIRTELHRAGVTWLYLGLLLRHMVVKGIASFLPIFLLLRIGVSPLIMGLLLAVAGGSQLAFMPLAGRIADGGSRKRLVLAGTVMSGGFALGLTGATIAPSRPAQLLVAGGSLLLMAGGFAALEVGTTSILSDLVPASRQTTFISLQSTVQGIGGILGPTLVGAMVVVAGYARAFAAVGMLAFVATVLLGAKLIEPERTAKAESEGYTIETSSGIPRPANTAFNEPPDER